MASVDQTSPPRRSLKRIGKDLAKKPLRYLLARNTSTVELPLSTWRLARDADHELVLDGVKLGELVARWGSPLYVTDRTRLADNAARFLAVPPGATKGCEAYASYKTNPVPGVLRAQHECGFGAEVVSHYELWLALRLGVDPSLIVFNGPGKSDESMADALQAGVGLINVNSRSEIPRLAAMARKLGKRPRVGVRVVAPGLFGGQFGERIDNGSAFAAFDECLAVPEFQVVALHAHSNHLITSGGDVDVMLAGVLGLADDLKARRGLELEILDLGGNLACATTGRTPPTSRRLAAALARYPRPVTPSLAIDDYVARVITRIEEHYEAAGRPRPRIFLEPGRSATANAQMLLTTALEVRQGEGSEQGWVVLDAGMNVAEPLLSEWHQLYAIEHPAGAPEANYRLVGPSCSHSDLLYPAWWLPRLSAGDTLAIMDAGAYFVPYATDFSRPRPGVVMIDQGREVQVRRAGTFEDVIARDLVEP